jgi:hypothetical protein
VPSRSAIELYATQLPRYGDRSCPESRAAIALAGHLKAMRHELASTPEARGGVGQSA